MPAADVLSKEKPNIIIIYADDMGYGDCTVNNPESKIPTPNIDRLAKEGLRFTDAHSPGTTCTASRYGLLTGINPARRGVVNGINGLGPVLEAGELTNAFSGKELAGLQYAETLTRDPAALTEQDIQEMRDAGFDDGEILEINQVTAYFSYANRMVLGLGIDTEGDIIGLSPGDSSDPGNWSHT